MNPTNPQKRTITETDEELRKLGRNQNLDNQLLHFYKTIRATGQTKCTNLKSNQPTDQPHHITIPGTDICECNTSQGWEIHIPTNNIGTTQYERSEIIKLLQHYKIELTTLGYPVIRNNIPMYLYNGAAFVSSDFPIVLIRDNIDNINDIQVHKATRFNEAKILIQLKQPNITIRMSGQSNAQNIYDRGDNPTDIPINYFEQAHQERLDYLGPTQ